MAHNAHQTVSPSSQDRICKACGRRMASMSPEGDLVPLGTQDQACDICKPFEELYIVMQAKDEAFAALESRRFQHLPRYEALEESKAAHRAFENFLIQTEAHFEPKSHTTEPRAPDSSHGSTLTLSANEGHDTPQPEEIRPPRPDLFRPSTYPIKRRRPSLNDGRRVSFDSTVVFYDKEHGRPDEAFSRSSKEYAPGRNAPAKGKEFLDTSGLNTTTTRFFGMKRHKKGWVETKEGREMDREWANDEKQTETEVEAANESPSQDDTPDKFPKGDDCPSSRSTQDPRQEEENLSADEQEQSAILSEKVHLVTFQNQVKPRSILEYKTSGPNSFTTSTSQDESLSVEKEASDKGCTLPENVSKPKVQ